MSYNDLIDESIYPGLFSLGVLVKFVPVDLFTLISVKFL